MNDFSLSGSGLYRSARCASFILLCYLLSGFSEDFRAQEKPTDETAEEAELSQVEAVRLSFDANQDGFLDANEREKLRAARVRRKARRRGPDRRSDFPPDIMERFDADGDGRLDREEQGKVNEFNRTRYDEIKREYDVNQDKVLNADEMKRLQSDLGDGKIDNLPIFLRSAVGKKTQDPKPGELAEGDFPKVRSSRGLKSFDKDGDGRLNVFELSNARKELLDIEPSEETKAHRIREKSSLNLPDPLPLQRSKPPEFSHSGGYHESAFQLALRASPSASLRFTLDGSDPIRDESHVYDGPIDIDRSTVVRAIAVEPNSAPSASVTRTFLFVDDIVKQSADGLPPPDFPYRWGRNKTDFGMDPRVAQSEVYRDELRSSFSSIPSVSLVMAPDDLFGKEGIYSNAKREGRKMERAGSIELIHKSGSQVFQENCGVRVRGGYSRSSTNPKHAFRLFFRREYGAGKLRYPFFGKNGARTFDHVDLRCTQNYSWSFGSDKKAIFIRDQFSRDTQIDMGQPGARGDYYHLFLNGVYWGLFNSCERLKASYGETYFGGDKEDFDSLKTEQVRVISVDSTDGNLDAWTRLYELSREDMSDPAKYQRLLGNNPDGTLNPDYEVLLDAENLIDYMLVILWTGNFDGPITKFLGNNYPNNWYALRDRTSGKGFQFFCWDSEHSLLDLNEDRIGPFPAGSNIYTSNPHTIFDACLDNPEFRLAVADRIHEHFTRDGALTVASCLERFERRASEIESAIIAESARWGDSQSSGKVMTRDQHWSTERRRLVEDYFPARSEIVHDQLWLSGLIPDVAPPTLSRQDVTKNEFGFSAKRGEIWMTFDGSDPRALGGKISGSALRYEKTFRIARDIEVRARVLFNDEWSALTRESLRLARDWPVDTPSDQAPADSSAPAASNPSTE